MAQGERHHRVGHRQAARDRRHRASTRAAPSSGVVMCARDVFEELGLPLAGRRAVIQGFGKVGGPLAFLLHSAGHAGRRGQRRRRRGRQRGRARRRGARRTTSTAHRHGRRASRAASRSTRPTIFDGRVRARGPRRARGRDRRRRSPARCSAQVIVEAANGPITAEADADPRRARDRRRPRHPRQRRRRHVVVLRVGAEPPGHRVARRRRGDRLHHAMHDAFARSGVSQTQSCHCGARLRARGRRSASDVRARLLPDAEDPGASAHRCVSGRRSRSDVVRPAGRGAASGSRCPGRPARSCRRRGRP